MPLRFVLAAAVALAFGTGQAAPAEYGYPADDGYSYNGRPVPPPSWTYDPYTGGIAACPQWSHRYPQDCIEMVPSYGQPSYSPWARR